LNEKEYAFFTMKLLKTLFIELEIELKEEILEFISSFKMLFLAPIK